MAASDILVGTGASSAAERLGMTREPTGKLGNPALTLKVRNIFSRYKTENPEDGVQWEEWLAQNPDYALGDNDHVYMRDKKDE